MNSTKKVARVVGLLYLYHGDNRGIWRTVYPQYSDQCTETQRRRPATFCVPRCFPAGIEDNCISSPFVDCLVPVRKAVWAMPYARTPASSASEFVARIKPRFTY